MNNNTVLIISATSDIGGYLAKHYLNCGARVYGSYRTMSPEVLKLENAGVRLFRLDITSSDDIQSFASFLKSEGIEWDLVISAPGLLSPIGPFFEVDFEEWQASVITNSLSQLRVLHAIYNLRTKSELAKVIFFAGGGTNSSFDNYSAYCIGKLVLVKMTELLDSECRDLQISILGTGWVNTKIHQQTLTAGSMAGENFYRTLQFLEPGESKGSSLETIAECLDWFSKAPRSAVGGRNFSIAHDSWREIGFLELLNKNGDAFKLRRKSEV